MQYNCDQRSSSSEHAAQLRERPVVASAVRLLPAVAGTVLAVLIVAAVVSIAATWPHQFAGHGNPHTMLQDFVNSGTALAPPALPLVVLAVAAFAARRRDVWRSVAAAVLVLLGVLLVVGALGEALAARSPDVPAAAQLASGVLGSVTGVILATVAGMSLATRRRYAAEVASRQSG